jgi:hypothetical protein
LVKRAKGRSHLDLYLRLDPASMRRLFYLRVHANTLALVPNGVRASPSIHRTITPVATAFEDALSANIEWIRKHTKFGELSRRWEEAGKPRALLLRSPALEEAKAWIRRW